MDTPRPFEPRRDPHDDEDYDADDTVGVDAAGGATPAPGRVGGDTA
ncbi:hypothetical protein ACFQV8_15965 [Pseudonocardia benzenivorans]